MKINLTVVLTVSLLLLMMGAGYLSSIIGFAVGHEAIKSVTQPDTRPTSKVKLRKGTSQQQGAVVMLKEEDILATVKARIEGKGKNVKPEKKTQSKNSNTKQTEQQKKQLAKTEVSQPGFPISGKNQGVALEVLSANYSGGTLLLKVNLKNQGSKTVRFLYSFLEVEDDKGRSLSADTVGLPAELPSNGEVFSGTISIPATLLDDVNKLTLTLTDYPEQQLRLEVPGIPVKTR